MKTNHRTIFFFIPLLIMMLFGFWQSAMGESSDSDSDILARAGAHVITQKDLEEAMQDDTNDLYSLPENRVDLLKELVRIAIFSEKAREAGLENDPEIQLRINKIVNFHLAKAYVEKHVKEAIKVSEDEALKWYKDNQAYFVEPEKIRVRQIFLYQGSEASLKESKKALAHKLLERIQKGEDFGALSKDFSDDEELKKKAGDLGYISRGALSPEYEDTVFKLNVDQVSPVLEGNYGYSIFKNEGRKPERLMPFDEVRKTVIKKIRQEKENGRFLEMERQLYEDYKVQIFEDKIK